MKKKGVKPTTYLTLSYFKVLQQIHVHERCYSFSMLVPIQLAHYSLYILYSSFLSFLAFTLPFQQARETQFHVFIGNIWNRKVLIYTVL